ncbi:MAG: hypothetical protein JJ899_10550 [Alphaproteobacteria bacterium]|nr:hypothetical protein [Alphaproteobacteria bacterium]
MRPILLAIAIAALAAAGATYFLLRLTPGDSKLAAVSDLQMRCPITTTVPNLEASADLERANWTVAVSNNEQGTAPEVRLARRSVPGVAPDTLACVLVVDVPPREPFEGIDWRIGHRIEKVQDLAGRNIRISMRISGSTAISLPTGTAYSYDGVSVQASAIGGLNPDPRNIVWQHEIAPDATFFEIWLRLTLHGPIMPKGDVYLLSTTIGPAQ